MRAPPTGFAPMPPRGPFLEANGPFYHDGGTRFGFVPETRHLNVLGFVHGGLLSTLMDSAMAHCAVAAHGHAVSPRRCPCSSRRSSCRDAGRKSRS